MKYLIFIFLLTSSLTYAEDRGNGGDGIYLNENLYLLDFVEEGIHKSPFIDEDIKIQDQISQRVRNVFQNYPVPIELIESKFQELFDVNPVLGLGYLLAAERVRNWRFLPFALTPIDDSCSNRQIGKSPVQLAIRSRGRIDIDATAFGKLTDKNQVGLIFHEIGHFVINSRSGSCADNELVREVTVHLFKAPLTSSDLKKLSDIGDYYGGSSNWFNKAYIYSVTGNHFWEFKDNKIYELEDNYRLYYVKSSTYSEQVCVPPKTIGCSEEHGYYSGYNNIWFNDLSEVKRRQTWACEFYRADPQGSLKITADYKIITLSGTEFKSTNRQKIEIPSISWGNRFEFQEYTNFQECLKQVEEFHNGHELLINNIISKGGQRFIWKTK